MSLQVISCFKGRNVQKYIELTENQKSIIIGSDDACGKGYIDNEVLIAPFHCFVYLRKKENQQIWETFIQEKTMNTQKYVTYVNDSKLKMRGKQMLFDDDVIKLGNNDNQLIVFVFHDEYMKRVKEKEIEVPEIYSDRFKNKNDIIGTGAHSVIYRARDMKNKNHIKDCICKIVKESKTVNQYTFKTLCQEPKLLQSLSHTNIIKVLGYYVEPDRLLIWQEMMYEDLEKYRSKVNSVSQKEYYDISFQILDALKYLHEKNILIDFGLARYYNIETSDRDMTLCGTAHYTPPEIHHALNSDVYKVHDLYKPPVDIWAFGVISFLLLSGLRSPFFNEDEVYRSDLVSINIIKRTIPKEPLMKKNIDKLLIHLITDRMLLHDHKKRITANELTEIYIGRSLGYDEN
ncbi:kinase-like protein [Rhizophagus irregularis]|uniref:Kinase-like protein n=1 Tax=Rhizophagus irregularis TaxID=588596 RepID=A0A2I1GLH8_9GLOM|nr:kinase-like protein [Rhizophagus irregularis]